MKTTIFLICVLLVCGIAPSQAQNEPAPEGLQEEVEAKLSQVHRLIAWPDDFRPEESDKMCGRYFALSTQKGGPEDPYLVYLFPSLMLESLLEGMGEDDALLAALSPTKADIPRRMFRFVIDEELPSPTVQIHDLDKGKDAWVEIRMSHMDYKQATEEDPECLTPPIFESESVKA